MFFQIQSLYSVHCGACHQISYNKRITNINRIYNHNKKKRKSEENYNNNFLNKK